MERRFLLWDHDGVLVDTEKWYFAATRECLGKLGCDLTEAQYVELMVEGGGRYWDIARRRGHSEAAIDQARQRRDEIYENYLATEAIDIEGVLDVLRELSAAYRMAIVSTTRRKAFDVIHRTRPIQQFFEFVITSEDCVRLKPAPDPYLQALQRFKAQPAEALVIEDSERGLRSAVAAGIDCVVIRHAFTAAQDFGGAWRILSSIRELPALLESSRKSA